MRLPGSAGDCADGAEEDLEVEEGVTGTIVEEGDTDAFASALASYLTDPDHRRETSAAARQRADTHFSTNTLIPRFLELYQSAKGKE